MGSFSLFARKCWLCDRDLPFARHGRGRNRRFCRPACRQKYYRQRVKARREQARRDEKAPKCNASPPVEGGG